MPAPSARPAKPGFDITAYLPSARPARVHAPCAPRLLTVLAHKAPVNSRGDVVLARAQLPTDPYTEHVLTDPLSRAFAEIGVTPAAEASAAMRRGSNPHNGSPVALFADLDGRLEYRVPRDLPWSAFPVMATPRFRLKAETLSQVVLDTEVVAPRYLALHTPLTMDEALATVEAILLVIHPSTDAAPWLARLANLLAVVAPARVPEAVYTLSPSGLERHSWADCQAHAARRAGAQRLAYGWQTNIHALAGRALLAAARQDDPEETGKAAYKAKHGYLEPFADPLALQILYDLARTARGGKPALRHEGEGVLWVGTGKHAAAAWDCAARVHNLMLFLADLGLVTWTIPASLAEQVQFEEPRRSLACFLAPGEDGTIWARLTPLGARFLALLHPDCDDADLPLRWRDADGLIGEQHIPAIDRCLSAMFRKMKRRVEDLPAR